MDILAKPSLSQKREQSILWPALRSFRRPLGALTAIHNEYGKLVFARVFNSKLLFVSKPEHIEQVYSQEARGLLSRDFLYSAKKPLFGDGLVNSKAPTWANQRRLMQPLFTKEAVATWETIIGSEARRTADLFRTHVNERINLTTHVKNLIQRIFIQVLIGKSVNEIDNAVELLRAIEIISEGLLPQLVGQIVSGGKLMSLMPYKKRRFLTAVAVLKNFINHEIAEKRNNPGHDLISAFIQISDTSSGYRMSEALLQDEVVNMFFAGQDTTINTLCWFFYLVGKHPDIQAKITQEIASLGRTPITSESLVSLQYTRAALHETLRLYPPTTALATQAVSDVDIHDLKIKSGTTIILSMYVTHRDPELWENPSDFYPEHFTDEKNSQRHKYAFYPFGGGLHNCIGRHFAELEMMIIIVTLLREISFKTTININEAIGITLKPNRPIIGTIAPV